LAIRGNKRSDQGRVDVLLHRAGIPSVNHKLVKAVAMKNWLAYTSNDGGEGARNAVGAKLFGFTSAQASRATLASIIPVPAGNTFVTGMECVPGPEKGDKKTGCTCGSNLAGWWSSAVSSAESIVAA
jgi:hypothetical protein